MCWFIWFLSFFISLLILFPPRVVLCKCAVPGGSRRLKTCKTGFLKEKLPLVDNVDKYVENNGKYL
jgi:hypothetical protein